MIEPAQKIAAPRDVGAARKKQMGGASRWLWCSLVIVVLDQLTKFAAVKLLDPGLPTELMPVLDLVLVYNPGAAFSILSTAGGWQRWLFIGFAVVISGCVLYWLCHLPRSARWSALALSLVLGGAVGNLIDRLHIGAVVDFIDFHVADWHWPAFNIADSAICVGAGLLVLGAFRPGIDDG